MEKGKDSDYKKLNGLAEKQLEQVSFIYRLMESRAITPLEQEGKEVISRSHYTRKYPVYEHHKPISKIIDLDILSDVEG